MYFTEWSENYSKSLLILVSQAPDMGEKWNFIQRNFLKVTINVYFTDQTADL